MADPLGVGVIGLGPRWRKRYAPALNGLRGWFRVVAVCDEVRQRADLEARRLGCTAAASPTQLLEDHAVEAVLLPDPQWFGLWPLEGACRAARPVFCCVGPDRDDAHADALRRCVAESRLPVTMEMPLRFSPAVGRFKELLASRLGAARFVSCELTTRARAERRGGPGALLGPAGISLIDGCLALLGTDPISVQAAGDGAGGWGSVQLLAEDGRSVQVVRHAAVPGRGGVCLRVVAERGVAWARLPGDVTWSEADGRHRHVIEGQPPLGRRLLERFHAAIRGGTTAEPAFDDACRILGWLRRAAQSAAEGRRLDLK